MTITTTNTKTEEQFYEGLSKLVERHRGQNWPGFDCTFTDKEVINACEWIQMAHRIDRSLK
jgi:hypothetical protein